MAVHVHWNNRPRARRDRRLNLPRINRVGTRIDIDKYRPRSDARNGRPGSKKRKGHGDYFVTGFDIQGHQSEQQRVRARGAANSVFYVCVSGNLVLQRFDFGAQSKLLRVNDAFQ